MLTCFETWRSLLKFYFNFNVFSLFSFGQSSRVTFLLVTLLPTILWHCHVTRGYSTGTVHVHTSGTTQSELLPGNHTAHYALRTCSYDCLWILFFQGPQGIFPKTLILVYPELLHVFVNIVTVLYHLCVILSISPCMRLYVEVWLLVLLPVIRWIVVLMLKAFSWSVEDHVCRWTQWKKRLPHWRGRRS